MLEPSLQLTSALSVQMTRVDKDALDLLAAWPLCTRERIAGLMGGVTLRRVNQLRRSLSQRGLVRADESLEHWQTVSRLWEGNKALANNLNLLSQLDYMGKLSSQLEWQRDAGGRPVRLVYTSAGQPTVSIIEDDEIVVDYKLF